MRIEEGMIDSVSEAVIDTMGDAVAWGQFFFIFIGRKEWFQVVMESRHVSAVHTPAEPAAFPANHPRHHVARHPRPTLLLPSIFLTVPPPRCSLTDVRSLWLHTTTTPTSFRVFAAARVRARIGKMKSMRNRLGIRAIGCKLRR